LDKDGQKISKSKGNGISVEEWLKYGTDDSLALFMYQQPGRAKRLHFDVIPKSVDEYIAFKRKFVETDQADEKYYSNPVYHILRGRAPSDIPEIGFSLLLNLVSACNTDKISVLKKYIHQFDENADYAEGTMMSEMLSRAINYYQDFIKPNKEYRLPSDEEGRALKRLQEELRTVENTDDAHDEGKLQTLVFSIGKEFEFELREWFAALYQILLGSPQGPRFGVFIKLLGVADTIELIQHALDGEFVA